jgi:hypothetical protein
MFIEDQREMMTSREHCMLVEDQEDGDVMRIS